MAVAIREKIFENSGPFLYPGEQVYVIMVGQTMNMWWGALSVLAYSWNNFRAVLITDRRIVVLNCGPWRMGVPKAVVGELPRNIRIGPASGLWWKCESLGERLWVHKRFHKDVAAADAALGW